MGVGAAPEYPYRSHAQEDVGMSIPVEQHQHAEHKRIQKIDEDATMVIVQVGEIAETQRKHTAMLERHTVYHQQHRSDLTGLRRDLEDTRAEMNARFSALDDDVAGLKTDVTGLKTDVSALKTDVSQIKDTLGVILSRLPEQPAA
ncbi:hypothetical protein [Catellatospora sichuanensis]|uniref:hypothetical protein n=1 Tax=Catellatospora sichuanensis TaxID=1969805 RepID=UPI0011820BB2|nr:hypothetical protein [Catellatospora sichuanensis]